MTAGDGAFTVAEQMIVAAAREIRDGDVVYTGVGLPTVAAFLAKLSHAPGATIVFETGIIRSVPCELPFGVDTLATQARADMIADVFYVNALAQQGRMTIGFLGGGQVDRWGNVNSTAIGDYRNPALRFPGTGGGCDIGSLCANVVIVMMQKRRRFPERVDFVSSPGYLDGRPGSRERAGLPPGTGPVRVITNLAIYGFEDREVVLQSVHGAAGVTVEQVRQEVSWDLRVAPEVGETAPPTAGELRLLREVVDPTQRFLRGELIL